MEVVAVNLDTVIVIAQVVIVISMILAGLRQTDQVAPNLKIVLITIV